MIVTTNVHMGASVPMIFRVIALPDLNRDLVGHWTFQGNATDLTTNENNGAVNAGLFVEDRHGGATCALDFDGATSGVDIPSSSSLNMPNGVSISLWLKARTLPSGRSSMLVGKSDYLTTTDYVLRLLPGGDVQWEYQSYHETASQPIQPNVWHHLVVTATAPEGAKTIYVDGLPLPATQRASTGSHGTVSNSVTIGCAKYWNEPWSEHFNGALDDVRIYNRALMPAEVAAIYAQQK